MKKETIKLIKKHLQHAREKHPMFPPNISDQLCVLGEEFGEACMSYNDNRKDQFRGEILDMAAVIVRILED